MSIPAQSSRKRIRSLLVIFSLLLLALIVKTSYYSIIKAEWLVQDAYKQWNTKIEVVASRGDIYDRNGRYLAQSASSKMVLVWPKEFKTDEQRTEAAKVLSELLDLDYENVLVKIKNTSKYEIRIKRQITDEQAEYLLEKNLVGVHLGDDIKRYYPNGNLLSQVLGYTTVDGVGQEGIEAQCNSYLQGVSGSILIETDEKENRLPNSSETYIPPIEGNDVVLTIDMVIQSFAEKAMEQCMAEQKAKSVTCIVMKPSTCEVLAMVSKPDFDNNNPPRTDISLLNELSRNRCITDAYEPGSTFKVFTTAAALDTGTVSVDSTFDCPGYRIVDGEKIKCWSSRPHGHQTLAEGLQHSCNPVFMSLGLDMGRDTFYEYIYNFGFSAKTNIGLSGESSGIVTLPKYVRNVDLARISFGQAIAVTPLQLATAACSVVNGGNLMKPLIVSKVVDNSGLTIQEYEPETVRRVIKKETSDTMRQLLRGVVDEGGGSLAAVDGYSVGGKTGTAQKYGSDGRIMPNVHVSSFLGFAPVENPEIVVLVVVNEPDTAVHYGSIVAAPYASMIISDTLHYLNVQPDIVSQDGTGARTVPAPDVEGLELEQAVEGIERGGFRYVVEGYGGIVARQMPAVGEEVLPGSTITLYLEQADDMGADSEVQVPDLYGKSALEANTLLKSLGLKMRISGVSGIVVEQNPAPGTKVYKNEYVTVTFGTVDTESEETEQP